MTHLKQRRDFLQLVGGIGSVAAVGSGCDTSEPRDELGDGVIIDFRNDTGLLNFAYALEQIESAFYERVLNSDASDLSGEERDIFGAIQEHEAVHRDALELLLGADAIAELVLDFSSIDLSDKATLLNAAQMFEDAGVAAYNGAGKYFDDPRKLALAGKIVSVEARHAAVVRELANDAPEAFADLNAGDMLDKGSEPSMGFDVLFDNPRNVLEAIGPFVTTPIRIINA